MRWLLVLLALGCTAAPAATTPPRSARYHLVAAGGARSFPAPGAGEARPLLPGFGVSVVEERLAAGRRWARTGQGRWIPLSELVPAAPSALRGVELSPGKSSFARDQSPSLRAAELRAPRPPGAGPTDRWIDVVLATQTLVAYEGDRAVFAALVSTGIGGPGSPLATPTGVFRIRSKHRAASMDNLEHTGVVPYSYEDIPLVQYFTDRVALHAALWHQRFGHPASHGCINLTPADAAWLFAFTAPAVPASAAEAWTRPAAPGTIVRIR